MQKKIQIKNSDNEKIKKFRLNKKIFNRKHWEQVSALFAGKIKNLHQ